MANHILSGILGIAVADALGVPAEFMNRQTLKENPVVGMRSYGTYHQPAGTWSDDTSMTLCLLDSLANGLDFNDIMEKFVMWFRTGAYTPFGEVFDIGITTKEALIRFENGTPPLQCGGTSEYDNGNGSLMRILPVLFYLESKYKKIFNSDEAFEVIHKVSALTHAHKRSQIACGIYISIAATLHGENNLNIKVSQGINQAIGYYEKQEDFIDELRHFKTLGEKDFAKFPEEKIKSSGYVVDTLEAAIWCLLNTKSYQECVLKAVNLGEDTDTVAAVAGGLAGLHYGYERIPEEWLEQVVNKDFIEDLCNQFHISMYRKSIKKLTPFIPYFESATKEVVMKWGGGEKIAEKSFTMPYPIYDATLKEFVAEVYKTNLMSTDYLDVINKHGLNSRGKMIRAITDADIEVLKAILTSYIRQERFNDGLWASAVEDKVFLKILNRLNEL